jgi:predicted kinase
MTELLPPLLLTGGPAVGKTVTGRALAKTTPRTAYVDVDDIRQLVRNGGAAPWDGSDGVAQQLLGVRNAAALAHNFSANGFNVTLTDVVDARTLPVYRQLLPDALVVLLDVALDEAWRRARTRRVYLTDAEFETIHRQQAQPLAVDHRIDVTCLDQGELLDRVRKLWNKRGPT